MVWIADPAESHLYPRCLFHEITGLYCPGCGMLRALHRLLHGDIAGALAMNPLLLLLAPGAALLALRPASIEKRWVPWAVAAALVLYGVARNVPFPPFSMLAPG